MSNPVQVGVQSFLAGVPGYISAGLNRRRANRRLIGPMRDVRGVAGPTDVVQQGEGPNYMGVQAGSDEQQLFNRMGLANLQSQRPGEVGYNIPTNPTIQNWQQALMSGALERYGTEQEKESEQRGAIDAYGNALEEGTRDFNSAIGDFSRQREAGLNQLAQSEQQGHDYIQGGQMAANAGLMANLQDIDSQIADFSTQAFGLLSQTMGMRGEALAAASDQSAKLLEDTTTAIAQKLQWQEAEIDGRMDIPPAQREAMKQRLRFVNGSETHQMAAKVMGQEAMRLDSVRLEHDAQVNNAINTITNASSAIRGQAIASATGAYGNWADAQTRLADAGRQLGQAYAELNTNYRATMTQGRATLQTARAGYRTAGRMDMYNMLSSMERAYLDLSPEFGQLIAQNLAMNDRDYARQVTDLQNELAALGMEFQVSLPLQQQGVQASQQILQTQWAPSPPGPSGLEQAGQVMGIASQAAGATSALGWAPLAKKAATTTVP